MGIGERRWTGPGLNGGTCYPLLAECKGLHTGNDRKEGGGKAVQPYQKCAATACCVVVRAPRGPFVQLTPDAGAVRRTGRKTRVVGADEGICWRCARCSSQLFGAPRLKQTAGPEWPPTIHRNLFHPTRIVTGEGESGAGDPRRGRGAYRGCVDECVRGLPQDGGDARLLHLGSAVVKKENRRK